MNPASSLFCHAVASEQPVACIKLRCVGVCTERTICAIEFAVEFMIVDQSMNTTLIPQSTDVALLFLHNLQDPSYTITATNTSSSCVFDRVVVRDPSDVYQAFRSCLCITPSPSYSDPLPAHSTITQRTLRFVRHQKTGGMGATRWYAALVSINIDSHVEKICS